METTNQSEILTFFLSTHPTMNTEQLQGIPKATITKELADLELQCAVCLNQFNLNEPEIRKLPCDHLYHTQCIFPWLQSNASCPVCRAQLLPNDRNHVRFEIGDLNLANQPDTIVSTLLAALTTQRNLLEMMRQHDNDLQVFIRSEVPSMPATANTHHSQIERPSVQQRERRAPQEHRTSSARTASNRTATTSATFASTHQSIVPNTRTRGTQSEAAVSSARASGHENPIYENPAPTVRESNNDSVRVPRRAAALRARSAIASIYGRGNTRLGKNNRS